MNLQKFTTIKAILFAFVLTITTSQLFAQTTNGIFFQAVARDNFSNPAKDRQIYVVSSIIQSTATGTKVLVELHKTNTDAMGVFNISLGNGTRTGGTASSLGNVDWSKGPFFLNLKIAITPFSAGDSWDYTKELMDMGTTSFGTVPFALYSASSAKVDNKLDASDTSVMLKAYAKAMTVQSIESSLATKLTAADTLTMLAPYAKAAYTIDSSFFKSQLATKLTLSDTIYYTKQNYTDSAIAKKLNIADSAIYVTKSQLASYNFSTGGGGVTVDTSSLSKRINLKANTTEITNLTSSLETKLSISDSTKYITPTQLAAKIFDTTSLSSRINLKASTTDVTSAINVEAITARAAELVLTNNVAANTASITSLSTYLFDQAASSSSTDLNTINNLNTNIASHTVSITANAKAIASEAATARAVELTLSNNVASNTSSISSNTTSINNLNTNVVSNTTSLTAINIILSAATSSNTTNTLVKRDANGNFSTGTINATSVNSPIYASAPQLLTDATTINWNPVYGLNASVTLSGNRTLSFTSTPAVGSYGTLVVTQDATGGRTITLPSTTNKVLGSTSGTSIVLSTTANAKDILNFYYDGTNCYWNIGQGYGVAAAAPFTLTTTGTGAATLSGTTLNIPSVSSSVNAGSISGTIAVSNGGTGASTQQASINVLTGTQSSGKYLRSDGTNATLSTIQAADIPTLNQNTTGNAATAGNITATSNSTLTSLSMLNTVGTITIGTISVTTDIKTTGTLTAGSVTYPKIHGTSGQVLSTTGSGILTWTTTAAQGVPYSGASGAVNLGVYELTANGVAVGRGASSKSNNYAYGYAVLSSNTTGNFNNAFGHQVLTANTTGQQNSGFGEYALPKNIGGNYNTAMGTASLKENTSGSGNTGFGYQTLQTNSAGSNNTALGNQANVSVDGLSNTTAIGNGATVSASNTIQLGNSAVTNLKTNGTITAKDVTYPNAHNATAGQVLTINASGTASWATPSSGGDASGGHYIGEVFGGGIVFYITTGGFHGMIASSSNIGGTPHEFFDRVSSPSYHTTTTNSENLYVDWVAPTYTQLLLLYNARNTAGLNLGTSKYHSSTNDPNDAFGFRYINFSNGTAGTVNGNWTDVNNGRGIRFF